VAQIRLLIIEDDPDQRDLIRETLECYFGTDTTVGVGNATEALRQQLDKFDLILADYNLPDTKGMQLLEDIKQRCDTPVIMVTGENVGPIAAEAIRRGANDYVVKFGDYLFTIPLVVEKNLTTANIRRENEQLRMELEKALREVREKNSQLEASLKRVEEMAATDPLTGMYNRRHFSKVLDQLYADAQRHGNDLACLMIDLDGYKQLNDQHGHQVGDQLLVMAGRVLSAVMRRTDVAARYGGDEFVLLLPHASCQEASHVAQRIRDEFRKGSAVLLRRNEGVAMSIGVSSIFSNHPGGADQLVALADAALYQAKDAGRNRIVMADSQAIAAAQLVPAK
jgi:two-component system, cell cycle response regulator